MADRIESSDILDVIQHMNPLAPESVLTTRQIIMACKAKGLEMHKGTMLQHLSDLETWGFLICDNISHGPHGYFWTLTVKGRTL